MMTNLRDQLIDKNILLSQLRDMDYKSTCSDTGSLSMKDILAKMSETNERHRLEKTRERSVSPLKHSLLQIRPHLISPPARRQDSPGTMSCSKASLPIRQDFTIARFRIPPPVWDGSFFPDAELSKSLYRTPIADASGKIILSLQRDEAKGVTTWIPPEVDRVIPPPSFASCTDSFKDSLKRHMDKTIKLVDDDFIKLPQRTERERRSKTGCGADLFNLVQEKEKLLDDERVFNSPTRTRTNSLGVGDSTANATGRSVGRDRDSPITTSVHK